MPDLPESEPPAHDPQPLQDVERHAAWLRELHEAHTIVQFETAADLATRVVADLHNLIFDRLVAHGARQLQGDFDGRIQRFLEEYLGRPDAPVPFRGCDAELAQLDRWLADPRAAPYALVAGPAGRGKSALLVRWASQLTRHPDLSLVYFPIKHPLSDESGECGVHLDRGAAGYRPWRTTARRAGNAKRSVEGNNGSVHLRRPAPAGRRLLVVLDGADESTDRRPRGPISFRLCQRNVSASWCPRDIWPVTWMRAAGLRGWGGVGRAWRILSTCRHSAHAV